MQSLHSVMAVWLLTPVILEYVPKFNVSIYMVTPHRTLDSKPVLAPEQRSCYSNEPIIYEAQAPFRACVRGL